MRIDLDDLPEDASLLQRLVTDMASGLSERDAEIERLQQIIKGLQRTQYGRSSERLDPDSDQMALSLEDLASDLAQVEPAVDETPPPESPATDIERTPRLPDHLPREDVRLEPGSADCPNCGGDIHPAGEQISEMLDWVPAQLRVIRIRRPKYACRSCGTLHQAPAPDRPIAKGLATPALMAQVLISKYCDHLPLYRQSQIFARQGVTLHRSTLANWVGGACWWLERLHERLQDHVSGSRYLFADDTTLPVLEPGRGRTRTGRLWAYVRDQRGWGGPEPPIALYHYAPDRKAERPEAHLEGFTGTLQVDGYAGFERLAAKRDIQLAACWAHARRKFYEVYQATGSPIAKEMLSKIARMYKLEASWRGGSPDGRLKHRDNYLRPILDALKPWLEAQLAKLSVGSTLAGAIRYTLARWPALCRVLDDGHIELDNNPVERAIRPIALGRKNHMFAGSDTGAQRWAVLASLIETAKLNTVEPHAYITDILTRLSAGYPDSQIDDLLPWNWEPKPADV